MREELNSRPETLPTDIGGYSNPSLLGEDDEFNRVGFMGGGKMHYNEGGSLLADDMPTHTMPDGTEMPGATHEEYEEAAIEEAIPEEEAVSREEVIPDEEMEKDYVEFIITEALDEKEKEFLMKELEGNDKLSIIFDKVVDTASEFSGEGPVDGPGTGVSDSIPARLSDGEFVFTAKAVDEIGADNLEAIMIEAEVNADKRQELATGGMPLDSGEEEVNANVQSRTVVLDRGFVPEEDDLVSDEIKKRMMDPSTQSRYVRS